MAFWWELLWQDENFNLKVSQRYSELRSNILSEQHIFSIIDSTVSHLGDAIDRNFSKWPILGNYVWPNYYVFETHEEEVLYLKSWISQRLAWMDSEILLLEMDSNTILTDFKLHQAYPNPFNPITSIRYELSRSSDVKLTIYDILGEEISTLVNHKQFPGSKLVQWDATNQKGQGVSAGVYLYSIEIDNFRDTKKVILLK